MSNAVTIVPSGLREAHINRSISCRQQIKKGTPFGIPFPNEDIYWFLFFAEHFRCVIQFGRAIRQNILPDEFGFIKYGEIKLGLYPD